MLQATNYETKRRLSKLVSLISPHLPEVTHLLPGKLVRFLKNDDSKCICVVNEFAILKRAWLICHVGLRSVIKAW